MNRTHKSSLEHFKFTLTGDPVPGIPEDAIGALPTLKMSMFGGCPSFVVFGHHPDEVGKFHEQSKQEYCKIPIRASSDLITIGAIFNIFTDVLKEKLKEPKPATFQDCLITLTRDGSVGGYLNKVVQAKVVYGIDEKGAYLRVLNKGRPQYTFHFKLNEWHDHKREKNDDDDLYNYKLSLYIAIAWMRQTLKTAGLVLHDSYDPDFYSNYIKQKTQSEQTDNNQKENK